MGFLDNFDPSDPKTAALMSVVFGLLSPKQQKTSFLQDVGQTGLLGMKTYGEAQQQQAKLADERQTQQLQIGRASCRERV